MVLILSEILLHAILAVRAIGWDSGFHYYLTLVAPIVYVSRIGPLPKAALVGSVFMCHLMLDNVMKDTAPLYLLDLRTLMGLRYFNVAVSFLLLSYLSGHYYGLIKDSERKLRELVRQQDSVARWGGEEFLVLMPQATPETARLVAERLREKISELRVPLDGGEPLTVSMTFGVSGHQIDEAIEAPMRRADAALYQGKAAGRNQVVLAAA